MREFRVIRSLKKILILVLCLAMVLNILPIGDYSVKVEAAGIPNYSMFITTEKNGQEKLTTSTTYSYTGLKETTYLNIESDPGGFQPTIDDVAGADAVVISWNVDSDNTVIAIVDEQQNKPEAKIKRVGPGAARITCNIKWNKDAITLVSKNITSTIKIPADINKLSYGTENNRALFTKLTSGDDAGNTVLMFNKDSSDLSPLGKNVILSYGTKSTSNSVNWEPANTSIADITRDQTDPNNEIVKVVPKKAGTTLITASSALSDNINDSFYAVIMPTFTFGGVTDGKTIPAKNDGVSEPQLKNLEPIIIHGGETIETNALRTSDLKWKVNLFPNKTEETDMLKLKTTDGAETYIESDPKAGVYRITAQTVVPGKTMQDELGIAQLYAQVPLYFPNGRNVVLGLQDVYNILDNSNIQSISDIKLKEEEDTTLLDIKDGTLLDIKDGIIKAKKDTGLTTVNMKIIKSAASKYGLVDDTSVLTDDYDKYVTNGVDFTFSIVDSFGINNSNITMAIKGTADLTVSSESSSGITWESSDDTIVEVTNVQGKTSTITAQRVGKATITVTQEINGVKKTATCKVTVVKSADSITIDPPIIDMNVNESKMITAKLTPDNMLVGNIKWITSDNKVVIIDSYNGKDATIKGVGDGTAIITAINTENSIIATCKVTVHGTATGIIITPGDSTVNLANKTLQLSAVVQPETNVQPALTWSTSDNEIATVNNSGLVTFVKSGNVKITAQVTGSPSISGSVNLKINRNIAGLKLKTKSKNLDVGEKFTLEYTLSPADATNTKINWVSTHPSVAKVDSEGVVRAVSAGQTIIMARTEEGGYVDTCTITVKQKAEDIKIKEKYIIMNKGDIYEIPYELDPDDSTGVDIDWETNKPKIATVSKDGKVTAVAAGSATIRGEIAGGETAYLYVTVIEKVESIKLNYDEKVIYREDEITLVANFTPSGATNQNVKWESSKPSVAIISAKGKVKGITAGTTIITCTTDDGSFKAICVIHVRELSTKIKLNHTFYAVGLKQSFVLKPTVTTTNATNKKVEYTSSNNSIASVNSEGKITGKKIGYTTITVTASDGSGARATCRVRVVRPTTSIKLNRKIMTMIAGRSTILKATIYPKNSSYKTVTWTSSKPEVARVLSDGTVTALSPGETTITASSRDNGGKKKAYCYITVREEVLSSGITVMTQNPVLIVGEKSTMSYSKTPADSTDVVTWESDNNGVATINRSTGVISARNSGTATIYAISNSGNSGSTTVTVIGMDVKSITLEQYTNYKLSITGAPAGVNWYSENPNIATVQNGNVITRRPGKTNIVAVVKGRKVYCDVRVTNIK